MVTLSKNPSTLPVLQVDTSHTETDITAEENNDNADNKENSNEDKDQTKNYTKEDKKTNTLPWCTP